MMPSTCSKKRVVLIGGGHAHVNVIKSYGEEPKRSLLHNETTTTSLTLITNTLQTPYSGMLPGMVSGHYTSDDIHIDLTRLCEYGGFDLIHASAVGVTYNSNADSKKDDHQGTVLLDNGKSIEYDVLSIDVGSSPRNPPAGVIPVKPISTFSHRYATLKKKLKESATMYTPDNPFTLLVVGGGAGGIELALSCQYALKQLLMESGGKADALKIVLATRGSSLLDSHNRKVQRIFSRILKERNVDVQYNANAIGIEVAGDETMHMLKLASSDESRESIMFHECLWCTSAGAASWLSNDTPFATTKDEFIKVSSAYECIEHPGAFAAGDCCHFVDSPRPKAGVFAVRAGNILRENIAACALGKQLILHKPQSQFLSLMSTGDQYAVASRGRFALEGAYLWKLKDRIDTKWMADYKKLS